MFHVANLFHAQRSRRYLQSAMMLCLAAAVAHGQIRSALADEDSVQLPDLVVSASRTPLKADEVGSAVTVVTAEEIERKQVRVVSDVLREIPGVAVSRLGTIGNLTQVRIRGAEGNQTLVIIDGMEVNDPSGDSEFNFGQLLAADIERIEVLRGPQSALYGSDAIGGVINIITKRGSGPAIATMSLEGGSFHTGQASASVRMGGERYHFSFGGAAFTTNGVSIAPKAEGNSEKDGHRNHSYNVKLGFEPIDHLEIDLSGQFSKLRTESDPAGFVAGIFRPVDGDSVAKTTRWTGRIQTKYSLFDGMWEHLLGAGVNQEKADFFDNGAQTSRFDGEKVRYDYQTNLFFETPAFAAAAHTLTFLVEREDESQTTRGFGATDLDITNYGFVGEYRLGLWERFFLSGSVRYDDNDIFKDATTFRVTAAYLLEATGTRLHGSYGTGVKNPSLFELFGFDSTFVPNPDLTPEKSKGWDMGVEQRFLGDRLSVDLTYFNNRITDLILFTGLTVDNQDGTTKIHGLELGIKASIMTGLTFAGQYTYTHAEDADGVELVRRPKHIASANFAYRFLDGRANLDLGIDYHGEQQDVQFNDAFERLTVTLDDYVLVNVAGAYEVFKGLEIFARIENLLDEDYQDVAGFDTPGIGGFAGVRGTVQLF